ncbi:MAG TPA: RDD family protein [Actinomycetota bacterium]|nr:RDD family protein [Actinomycetota bacterium]
MSRPERTVTPEAVTIVVDVAGLGSRTIAWLVDTLIQLALVIPILIGVGIGEITSTVEVVVIYVVIFLIVWAYFPLFEFFGQGRTPGKRAQRLRVVRTDGQPAGGAAIMVRNLIRIVDVFLFPFLAVISMLVTARAQRLGDLAAGTMVVREARLVAPETIASPGASDLPAVDATGLSEREYDMIRSFLARRSSLDPSARHRLAGQLAASVRARVGSVPERLSDEEMLEAVSQSYRRRFGGASG